MSPPDQQHLIFNYTLLHPLCSSPDQQCLISPPDQQCLIFDFISYSSQPLLQTSNASFPLPTNNVSSSTTPFSLSAYLQTSSASFPLPANNVSSSTLCSYSCQAFFSFLFFHILYLFCPLSCLLLTLLSAIYK